MFCCFGFVGVVRKFQACRKTAAAETGLSGRSSVVRCMLQELTDGTWAPCKELGCRCEVAGLGPCLMSGREDPHRVEGRGERGAGRDFEVEPMGFDGQQNIQAVPYPWVTVQEGEVWDRAQVQPQSLKPCVTSFWDLSTLLQPPWCLLVLWLHEALLTPGPLHVPILISGFLLSSRVTSTPPSRPLGLSSQWRLHRESNLFLLYLPCLFP